METFVLLKLARTAILPGKKLIAKTVNGVLLLNSRWFKLDGYCYSHF